MWGLDEVSKSFLASPIGGASGKIEKPMCGAPFHNLVIDWDGSVRVCGNSWVQVGNLSNSPLDGILRSSRLGRFQNMMENGDYLWCSSHDKAAPKRLSLAHRYAYQLQTDPGHVLAKTKQKCKQAQCTWAKARKRSKPSSDPNRTRLPLVNAPGEEIPQPARVNRRSDTGGRSPRGPRP